MHSILALFVFCAALLLPFLFSRSTTRRAARNLGLMCAALAFTLALTGCASWERSLPLVNAESFRYVRNAGVTTTTIEVSNLKVTDTEVSAEKVDVSSAVPLLGSVSITMTGYRRERRLPPDQ